MRLTAALVLIGAAIVAVGQPAAQPQRLLYVALPASDATDPDRSVRMLVFDIARAHRMVRRISLWPAVPGDEAEIVRGTAAHVGNGRFYISTTKRLAAIDLKTDKVIWQSSYEEHCCDRIALSPDGRTIYAPALGRGKWFVVDAATGALRASIDVMGWPRQTIYSRDGTRTYLGAWESTTLSVVDATRHEIVKTVGPFSAFLCPFTVNGKSTLAFANVDGLVGFEVGDLQTGLILDRVAAEGYDQDAAAQYECPSHGIALTPDERELWIADGVQNRVHIFDAREYPPVS